MLFFKNILYYFNNKLYFYFNIDRTKNIHQSTKHKISIIIEISKMPKTHQLNKGLGLKRDQEQKLTQIILSQNILVITKRCREKSRKLNSEIKHRSNTKKKRDQGPTQRTQKACQSKNIQTECKNHHEKKKQILNTR